MRHRHRRFGPGPYLTGLSKDPELATPGARIYELDERGIAPCGYDELDTVRLMRGFLDAPERFLRAALED